MAAYIRNYFAASHKDIYECGCNEILILKVCGKFNISTYFPHIEILILIIVYLIVSWSAWQPYMRMIGKPFFFFVGDFNVHHRVWSNSVSPANCHGLRAWTLLLNLGVNRLHYTQTYT